MFDYLFFLFNNYTRSIVELFLNLLVIFEGIQLLKQATPCIFDNFQMNEIKKYCMQTVIASCDPVVVIRTLTDS